MRSTLLSHAPFPTVDDVYNALTQEEDSRMASRAYLEPTRGFSYAVQSLSRTKVAPYERVKIMVCGTFCQLGHGSDNCFRQIGYTPWWGDRPRNKRNKGSDLPPMKNKGKEMAHVFEIGVQGSSSSAITDADRVGLAG